MVSIKQVSKCYHQLRQIRKLSAECCQPSKPRHLICFKQWTSRMVVDILTSAINLKFQFRDTHEKRLNILQNVKVMILEEVNQPLLSMAVSKAATLLGAYDVSITDKVVWEHDYMGKVFSTMADVIFVSTATHMCIQRFAEQSSVPVLCMSSRTHASIQSLSTVMAIMEEFGTLACVNISYVGPSHPVLNSYLLLCPMLGANIRFKCCCQRTPVSPLLLKASEEMTKKLSTVSKECKTREEALQKTCVVIAGPTLTKKDKIPEFTLTSKDISRSTCSNWIFFHTCPRGKEVDDNLFYHFNSRTFKAFENMHYIAAALMAYTTKNHVFRY